MFYTTKSLYEVWRIKTAATFLWLENKAGLGGQAEFLFSSINAVVIGPLGLSDDPWVNLELYPVCFSNSRLLIGSDNQRRCGALRWLRCLETGGLRRGNIEDKSARDRKTRLCLLLHKHLKKKKKQTIYLTPGPHRRTFGELTTRQEKREMTSGRLSLLLIGSPKKLYLHEVNEFKQVQVFLFFFWMCR